MTSLRYRLERAYDLGFTHARHACLGYRDLYRSLRDWTVCVYWRLHYRRRMRAALAWAQSELGIKRASFLSDWCYAIDPRYTGTICTATYTYRFHLITLYSPKVDLFTVFHEAVHALQHQRNRNAERVAYERYERLLETVGLDSPGIIQAYRAQPHEVDANTRAELMVERAPAWLVSMWE